MENNEHIKKRKARQRYKRIRSKVPSENNQLIYNEVLKFVENIKERNNLIGIYWPINGEVDLRGLKQHLGLKIALPACNKEREISYHQWIDSNLIKDSYGIPAPITQPILSPEELSLIIVPALSIDMNGIRLGYGGGCFDRLRSKPRWKDINAYTVISEDCISNTLLPKDQWDIPFNGWINEKGVFQINN